MPVRTVRACVVVVCVLRWRFMLHLAHSVNENRVRCAVHGSSSSSTCTYRGHIVNSANSWNCVHTGTHTRTHARTHREHVFVQSAHVVCDDDGGGGGVADVCGRHFSPASHQFSHPREFAELRVRILLLLQQQQQSQQQNGRDPYVGDLVGGGWFSVVFGIFAHIGEFNVFSACALSSACTRARARARVCRNDFAAAAKAFTSIQMIHKHTFVSLARVRVCAANGQTHTHTDGAHATECKHKTAFRKRRAPSPQDVVSVRQQRACARARR